MKGTNYRIAIRGSRKKRVACKGPCTTTMTTMIVDRGRMRTTRRQEDHETTTTGVATTMVCHRMCDYHHYSPEEEERRTMVTTTGAQAQGEGCHYNTMTRMTVMTTTMQDRLQERSPAMRPPTSLDYVIRLTDRLRSLLTKCMRSFHSFSKVSRACPKFLTWDVRTNDPRTSTGYPSRKLSLWVFVPEEGSVRGDPSILHPFSYAPAPIGQSGHNSGEGFVAVFWALLVDNPLRNGKPPKLRRWRFTPLIKGVDCPRPFVFIAFFGVLSIEFRVRPWESFSQFSVSALWGPAREGVPTEIVRIFGMQLFCLQLGASGFQWSFLTYNCQF